MAYNTWTQKTNFTGTERNLPVVFSNGVNVFAYAGAGASAFFLDGYMYDRGTNAWTSKADITDEKSSAKGFAIGDYGYTTAALTASGAFPGSAANVKTYEYDTINNTWATKADYGGTSGQRLYATYVIGTNGYVCTGAVASKEHYMYSQSGNSWASKAAFGAALGREGAIGFALNGKGYVMGGYDGSNAKKDLWQYDPTGNTWTQKADGAETLYYGGEAHHSQYGYSICGAKPDATQIHQRYNDATNTWETLTAFAGAGRYYNAGATVGNYVYNGFGRVGSNPTNDWYEWDGTPDAVGWLMLLGVGV